jgi:hypothetical protein
MSATLDGMYTSNSLDLCSGNSGGGVVDTVTTRLTAVVTGEATFSGGSCAYNLFVPNINTNGVDAASCERARGGVSVECLMSKIP